jgi:myosin heavy subunit
LQEVTVPAAQSKDAIPMDEAALKTYDNMIKLNDLNEPTILHNLRQRFLKDEIYTYVSSILVACNPFKLLPIYTPDVMERYKDGKGKDQPPHIYAISDNAYRSLMDTYKDQAVVISGESGAGKTETMKLVLQFLADVSGRAQKQTATGEKAESLEQQILKSNPVMEAFGNAKTTRNNNSSRFGKWTEIKFNRYGTIVGGSIINYLLEKSRIPFQAQQERNYHIFYQLLAGAELDLNMKKLYKLKDAEEFHYMNQSGVTTVDTINDEKDWLEMSGAMDVLNMTPAEKECVFRLVAAILQLGNVEFEKDPKGSEETDSKIKNMDQFKIAAELLKVDCDTLAKGMCYKKITRPGSKSVTYARYSITKANDARDATSKALYGKLFDWLIAMINKALGGIGAAEAAATSKDKICTIGVLDIFGFESFATNSFEQLCINYCNEK